MADTASRHLLLVAGMHRSGTSALCAALQAAGASFGEHLLEAMVDVNDEGFWEDAEVVALNEDLLASHRARWYQPGPLAGAAHWEDPAYTEAYERAAAILARGFGEGAVEAVKDPRFCLTLPFWLRAATRAGLAVTVCVASRAPLEVAQSLQRRDGFPLGYGLRLWLAYSETLQQSLPGEAVYVAYPALLTDPVRALAPLADATPGLSLAPEAIEPAVRSDLRHQAVETSGEVLSTAASGPVNIDALREVIAEQWPLEQVLDELVQSLVERGSALTEIGEAHSEALATITAKDGDNAKLAGELQAAFCTIEERDGQIREFDRRLHATGEELGGALATINERDQQIRELDGRLQEIGAMHSHALEVIAEKDRQIAEYKARIDQLCNLPVIGLAFRMAKKHAQR